MDRIADILKESIGLDVASVGWPTLERAVSSRMSASSVADVSTYEQCVRASRAELQALIEAIVVPETWFFRDPEAFAVLVRAMLERRSTHGSSIRVLSVPSSTGEEPYSIAMALLDAGLAPDTFHVDAIDVSGEAIARAKRGRYGRNSFRGRELTYRARHFEPVESDYRVSSRVRNQVTFRQGSLFDPDVLSDSTYDAVFCRNLLIYFDRATQDRAVRTLRRRLASDGLLFVAPSEAALILNHQFTPLRAPLAFAFRRSDAEPRHPRVTRAPRATSSPVVAWAMPASGAPALTRAAETDRPARAEAATAPDPEALLNEAARLGNEGHLDEAARRCEAHLTQYGPSVRAFHLLGMVRDAAGQSADAIVWYRKALYLDPRHQEVLLHLALILERTGQRAEGHRLRERAGRANAVRGATA